MRIRKNISMRTLLNGETVGKTFSVAVSPVYHLILLTILAYFFLKTLNNRVLIETIRMIFSRNCVKFTISSCVITDTNVFCTDCFKRECRYFYKEMLYLVLWLYSRSFGACFKGSNPCMGLLRELFQQVLSQFGQRQNIHRGVACRDAVDGGSVT